MNDSIFGSSAPKFIANYGLPSATEVLLGHWVPDEIEFDPRKLELESECATERDIIYRGEYLVYSGKVYLWKYGTGALSKFNEIYQFRYNKTIALWEHRDGQAFKDEDGNVALFALDQIKRSHFKSLVFKDVLHLTFVSLKGINHGISTPVIKQISEIKIGQVR